METTRVSWGYIGIMGKKMETIQRRLHGDVEGYSVGRKTEIHREEDLRFRNRLQGLGLGLGLRISG